MVTRNFEAVRISRMRSRIVRRGDRPLDERDVVRTCDCRARRLEEIGDLDLAGDREQLVFEVEQAELAAVARRELPDRESRLGPSLQLPNRQPWRQLGPRVHGAVEAHERRPDLAVAALPDPAFHDRSSET